MSFSTLFHGSHVKIITRISILFRLRTMRIMCFRTYFVWSGFRKVFTAFKIFLRWRCTVGATVHVSCIQTHLTYTVQHTAYGKPRTITLYGPHSGRTSKLHSLTLQYSRFLMLWLANATILHRVDFVGFQCKQKKILDHVIHTVQPHRYGRFVRVQCSFGNVITNVLR